MRTGSGCWARCANLSRATLLIEYYLKSLGASKTVILVPVQDTLGVAAAKVQFFPEYNKQAAFAAAAPDDNSYYY